jgi:hypothetical protein
MYHIFEHPAFFHRIFLWVLYNYKNAAIISLNSINQLIFVMETLFLCGRKQIFRYYLDEVRASEG